MNAPTQFSAASPAVGIPAIADAALAQAESLVPSWFPAGKRHGNEWVLGGLDGASGRSLSINLKTGAWSDFATDDKGGDLVSLIAARDGLSQLEAAKAIADEIGMGEALPAKRSEPKKKAPPADEYRPLMPVPAELRAFPRQLAHWQHGRFSRAWRYVSEDGLTLHYVCRYDTADGKEIVPWTYDPNWKGGSWRAKHAPAPRPLYGLDRLAMSPDLPVIVVEGEKAADAAQTIIGDRAVVTTWSGGSKAVRKADWSPLTGREVVIWPDADEPGVEAAKDVVAELKRAGAAACRRVRIEGAEERAGWDLADALEEGWCWDDVETRLAETAETLWKRDEGAAVASNKGEGPEYPYHVAGNGCIERETGDGKLHFLCSPIRVLALSRDATGKEWGRLVEIVDPDGCRHQCALPAQLFAGDGSALCAILLSFGLRMASGRKAKAAMLDLLMNWRTDRRAATTNRLGWADETCQTFILGDGRVLGGSDMVFQSEHPSPAAIEIRSAGSLEEWRENVASLCVGNPILLLSASLAFSGPLLEVMGRDGGGVHLRGASSRGKSTALLAAVSAWGSPGFKQPWRATSNGLEGVAAACNSTLLALDEMGEVRGRDAGEAAYMLANGQGKARAGRDGMARRVTRWKVAILSTGEIGLRDKIAEDGGRVAAGQEVRLIDLVADDRRYGAFDELHGYEDPALFAVELTKRAARAYGTAGPAFVQRLLEMPADERAALHKRIDDVATAMLEHVGGGVGLDGQCKRAAARFALIAVAGETATEFSLTGWPKGAAKSAAIELFEDWVRRRGADRGPAEKRAAIARTRAFLAEHGSSRFERIVNGQVVDEKIVRRAGWRDDDVFFIQTDVWDNEVHKGSDPKRAAQHLHEERLLLPGEEGRLVRRLPRCVTGRPRAYAVPASILGGEDD